MAVSDSNGKPISRKPDARCASPIGRLAMREEAVDQQIADAAPIYLDRDRAADQLSPAAQDGNVVCFRPFGVKSVSLAVRQECQRATDCQGSSCTPFSANRPAT